MTITRVALYARFSSDAQSQHSIDDQERVCRERAAREGWEVVDVYATTRSAAETSATT